MSETISLEEKEFLNNYIETLKTLQRKLDGYVEFLSFKYKLKQNDQLKEDGTITRNEEAKNAGEGDK